MKSVVTLLFGKARNNRMPVIIGAVICTVGIALFFQGWIILSEREKSIDLVKLRAANRAQAVAHDVRGIITQVDIVLADLRRNVNPSEIMYGPSPSSRVKAGAMNELIRSYIEQVPHIRMLHVVSADGRYVYTSNITQPTAVISDRAYFREQLLSDGDNLVVSTPLFGRVSHKWGIFISRRIVTPDGTFAGIVLAMLDAETIGSVMGAVDRSNWTFALYHTDLELVSRSPVSGHDADVMVGTRSDDPILREWKSAGRTSFHQPGLGESKPFIWALEKVEGVPFVVAAGSSESSALSRWRVDTASNAAVSLLLVAGCAVIIMLLRKNEISQMKAMESGRHYRAIFNAAPDALVVMREDRAIEANRLYLELFNLSGAKLKSPWELSPDTQPDGTLSENRRKDLLSELAEDKCVRRKWTFLRPDGAPFEADISVTLYRGKSGDETMMIIHDLTEMREMEDKLHQSQKLDAIGQLAGGIAHDFNNMLTAILSSAEILSLRAVDENQRKLSSTILSAAERAGQLTKKLLAFARKGRILSSPVDVHAIIREVEAILSRTIDRRIRIITRLESPESTVIGDPSVIQNALINLGVNARDAMSGQGDLTISTEIDELRGVECVKGSFTLHEGKYLHVRVSDTGCGIPAEHMSRIFDPFFTTKETEKGTGLGLASVFGAMGSHNGAVTVESAEGRGSVFHLYFPLAAAAVSDNTKINASAGKVCGRILVIDDEQFVRAAVSKQVESLGYSVIEDGDAVHAIEEFRSTHADYSCVLLDVIMPEMSGTDALVKLRAIDPGIPVILMSGYPKNEQISRVLENGHTCFIQKPFSRSDLSSAITSCCRMKV